MVRAFAGLLAVSLALLSGCASIPEASPELDRQAKTFSAPSRKAGVYIYRNEHFGAAIQAQLLLDGNYLGHTGAMTYYYVEVPAGRHTITGKAENESVVTFDAVNGRLYYVWQEIKLGLMTMRNELKLVDEATGRAGVLECKRVVAK
jgi:hypothetical protein